MWLSADLQMTDWCKCYNSYI